MSRMKDLMIRLVRGGDDAVEAAIELMPKWTSVKKRMPEDGQMVLFYAGRSGRPHEHCVHVGQCVNDGQTGGPAELRIVDLVLEVATPTRDETWPDISATHWMPLPDGPI